MEVKLISKKPDSTDIVAGLWSAAEISKHPLLKTLGKEDLAYLTAIAKKTDFDKGKTEILRLPSNPARAVMLLGLGEKKKWTARTMMLSVRKSVSLAKEAGLETLTFSSSDFTLKGTDRAYTLGLMVQNILMAGYSYLKHKEEPKKGWPEVKTVNLLEPKISAKLTKAFKEAFIIGRAVNNCRDLADTPGGEMTPALLAGAAEKTVKEIPGLKIKVLDEIQIRKLGMGGVIGVSQGSVEKPKFIILEYGPTNKKPLVFVGKGVTFDTGGINIKVDPLTMHMDMSGGAAVLYALEAIARLKLPVRVIGLIPTVENMPSGSSYRPGDLLKTYKGKTIEVLNTDAEGRVILADALGYAQDYKPQIIVDVATLTGAAMGALGQRMSALFSNQEKLLAVGQKIGNQSGDFVWPMPLWEEYDEEIKGTFGDVANIGKTRYGGAITAAAFLKQFVGEYPWMHLDIAPTMTSIEGQYLAKGAIGAGVRFLVELARQYK
ncbi:MAG: leucyl aminopeptidase [Patescibacteria group bacterium]|nr:leucyl aminopeptidase [Patescibacteria group bacterium]